MGKQARAESREMRKARAAIADRRSRTHRWIAVGGAVVIVALVVAIVINLVGAADRDSTTGSGPLVTPKGATPAGALVIGQAAAPVRLEIYLDYMCPFCGRFERANGAEIDKLVNDGTVRLELYPLAFLDRMSSGTRYSTRAANAVATVADRSPAALLAFHTALFGRQPAEGSAGLSDAEIAELARASGVPQAVTDAFAQRIFEPWVTTSTQAVLAGDVSSTPTVKINGTVFKGDLFTVGPLTQAIQVAAKK